MKADEEIAAEVAAFTPIVGPTHAEWYREAYEVGYGHPPNEILLACRLRESIRQHAQMLGVLAEAASSLIDAAKDMCSVEHQDAYSEKTRYAIAQVEKALWWKEPVASIPVCEPGILFCECGQNDCPHCEQDLV